MKRKLLLLIALCSLNTLQSVSAQTTQPDQVSKAERKFTANTMYLNHQHIVDFGNGTKLLIEMFDVNDYSYIKNLDSLMLVFYNDFANFKDSLGASNSGNLRIDYLFTEQQGVQAIRFKKNDADGDMYLHNKGELARLKLENDTVRILISKYSDIKYWGQARYTPIQLTFKSKDFEDILKLKSLNKTIERVAIAAKPKKSNSKKVIDKSTILYNVQMDSLQKFSGLVMSNESYNEGVRNTKSDMLVVTGNIGLAVIRDRISPFVEFKLQFAKYWGGRSKAHAVYGISATPYFLFEKRADGHYTTNANWFLNAEFGSIYDGEFDGFKVKSLTIGAGYLLKPTNNIFTGKTAKAYLNIGLKRGFQIAPEIIFTDNFRQVFPGITLRIFKQ